MSQGGDDSDEENGLQRQLGLGSIDPLTFMEQIEETSEHSLVPRATISGLTFMEQIEETSEHSLVPRATISGRPRGGPTREPLPDSIYQKQFLPTEMGCNDYSDLALNLAIQTVDRQFTQAAQKSESLFSSACIYRVPQNLRRLNDSAYTPHLIAIGALHRHDRDLRETPMKHVKPYYANYLFLRLTKGIVDPAGRANKNFEVLQECLKEMKKVLDDAQKSYAEEGYSLDEQTLVVDGCFILELLYSYYDLMKEQERKPTNGGASGNSKASSSIQQPHEGEDSSKRSSREQEMADPTPRKKEGRGDPIFDSLWIANNIKRDLLLLENQIPFFVLEKLFKLTVEKIPNCPHKRSLTDYILFYFQDTMSPEDNSKNRGGSPNDCVLHISGKETTKNHYHILHLLHDNYLPSNMQESGPKTKFSEFTLSATNLEYAGVKFKPLSGNNLFDVKFNEDKGLYWWCRRASFEIPTIGIHDPTEPFLRNLIAFEQCCPGVSQHFTSYAFLMSILINSQADVQVLKNAKVIKNYLGADEDTSNLFNKLCKEVIIQDFYFADTCSRAFKYSERGWPTFMAYLKRTYFGSPWAFIGFCVAFIAFGMSVIQFGLSFLNKSG